MRNRDSDRNSLKLNFSGHETFPVRHGWLKKAFDSVEKSSKSSVAVPGPFSSDEAIGKFGVGRNMVASMQHWAQAADVIATSAGGRLTVTKFGKYLFSDTKGRDPYMDYAASIWLIHWKIATNRLLSTTWHFAFNLFGRTIFDKDQLETGISEMAKSNGGRLPSANTLKRDIDCFVNCYLQKTGKRGELLEDSIECPLIELGLIVSTPERGTLSFDIGPKASLDRGVFYFALAEFLAGIESKTASLEQVTHHPGSPGRVFKLTENEVAQYLSGVEEASHEEITWKDSAGLRQIQIQAKTEDRYRFLKEVYQRVQSTNKQTAVAAE